MTVAGLDISTKQIDCCLLSVDDDSATWHEWDIRADSSFDAARRVREAMPSRSWWENEGVVMVGIEKPFSVSFRTAIALHRVQGAILASLPPDLTVMEVTPQEWKFWTVGVSDASKQDVRDWVVTHVPFGQVAKPLASQDACDAYAVAHTTRGLCERAAESAA